MTLDEAQLAAGREWKGARPPVLLLASTREGEEKMLLDELPTAALAIGGAAPSAALRRGRAMGRRAAHAWRDAWKDARVYLGDTMGEMAFYYAACDVAVIGGCFMPLGGQNLIEALAAGAPVVLGPSMFNFAERPACPRGRGGAPGGRRQSGDPPGARAALQPGAAQRDGASRESLVRSAPRRHRRHVEVCAPINSEELPSAPSLHRMSPPFGWPDRAPPGNHSRAERRENHDAFAARQYRPRSNASRGKRPMTRRPLGAVGDGALCKRP